MEIETSPSGPTGAEIVPQKPKDALPFNSCDEFVKWLARKTIEVDLDIHIQKLNKRWTMRVFGSDLAELAYFGYDRHINNGFGGFKPELTDSGNPRQGAGIYGHVLFSAGVRIIRAAGDPGGLVAHHLNRAKDWIQAWQGNDQYPSERAGNIAGRAAGEHMATYFDGKMTGGELINRLRGVLCQ